MTTIGAYTFFGCSNLTSIIIPKSVTSIGSSAFYDCNGLKKVIVPDIAAWCNISFYDYYANPLYYAHHLFSAEETEITSLVIPENVTKISHNAFEGCSSLTSVTIPPSLISIGNHAFYNCSGLKKVIVPDIAAWCNISFGNSYANPLFYAHHLFSDEEEENTNLIIPEGVTNIGYYAFSGCKGLTSVTIPKSVTSIDAAAIPNGTTIFTPIGKHLLTLWNAGYKNIKETKSERDLGIPVISSVATRSSSSTLSIENYYPEFSYAVQMSNVSRIIERKDTCFTGLDPDTKYSMIFSVTSEDFTYTSNTISFKTDALTLTTQQPKVISSGNVIVSAMSNLDDEETKVGFEWRRIDWTDDFASNTGGAYLFGGKMEGYIRNMYTEKLWKYRPYYESNSGNQYYGEWVGIDPTNTSYFEPTVYTYSSHTVSDNTAEVKGYAMRGSDNVMKQGFMYWEASSQPSPKAKEKRAPAIPANAKMVEAKGNVMVAKLENLDYDTEYRYVAFVKTSSNETFYGEEQSFKTGAPSQDVIDGIELNEELRVKNEEFAGAVYDLNGRRLPAPQKGINIIRMSDGTVKKVLVK